LSNLYVFLGPPGAGKGTQAQKIASTFDLAHISTGDMLRGHVSNGTQLGIQAKSLLDEGKLVPDDLVIKMLIERLNEEDCKNGAILDGFPRTLPQATVLTVHPSESIKVRLEVYKEDTEPLIDFYKEFNDVVTINALGDIEEIYKTIEANFS
jgi:adenylate kinase family enzyme